MKYQMHSAPVPLKLSFTVIIGWGKQTFSNVIGFAAHRLHWPDENEIQSCISFIERTCERERPLDGYVLHSYIHTGEFFSLFWRTGYMESWNAKYFSVLCISNLMCSGWSRKFWGLYCSLISQYPFLFLQFMLHIYGTSSLNVSSKMLFLFPGTIVPH